MRERAIGRRVLLQGAIGLAACPLRAATRGAAYAFRTAEFEAQVTVEFHDRYAGSLAFRDLAGRGLCLSLAGEDHRGCATGFVGSLAIVHYTFRRRPRAARIAALRERVRTIDQDARLPERAPVDRAIELLDGVGSDVQAFGCEADCGAGFPWYYFRQDLFVETADRPFLVAHWRHTPDAIRILDVIPGEGTWAVK